LKILVLGSEGRLGKFLCPYLEIHGHTIFKYFRISPNKDSEYDNFNLTIESFLKNNRIDIIINLIALTDLNLCESNIKKAYCSNISTLKKFIPFIKQNKTHLIHISSDQVYSGIGPHKENNILPLNVYGLTKYFSEIIAESVNATILRTNYIAKSIVVNKNSLTDWMVSSFIKKSKITLYKNILFSPLHSTDLCKFIELICRNKINGTFNLGSNGFISKADLGIELASSLSLDISNVKISDYNTKLQNLRRPLDMRMDSSKFEKKYNLKLPDIKDTIKLVIDDYKNSMP